MNSFGNGVVLPFLVIYLHNVRGFGLGVSGLVVATSAAAQLTAGIAAGPLVDRLGARRVLGAGLVMQSVGMGLFPLVRSPWEAFVLIAIEGAGSAGFWPSQSTLIAHLTPPERRHAAYAQQRVTMNLGIGLGGLTGGLIASGSSAASFTVLFLVDAATFLAVRRGAGVHPRRRAARTACGRRTAGLLPGRASRPRVRRALGAQLPLRERRLLPVQPRPAVRPRPGRPQRASDRCAVLREHDRDRDRAAPHLSRDRRTTADARARADAAALDRRLAVASISRDGSSREPRHSR